MYKGVLLDKLGRPKLKLPEILGLNGLPVRVNENVRNGWYMPQYGEATEQISPDFGKLPQHILDNLEKAGRADFSKNAPFLNSAQGWTQVEGVIITDGPVLTAAAEAIIVPDYLLAIPRTGMKMVGVTYEYILHGELSMAITTPGTFIHRMRYGGVAGILLATSDTIAPTGTQVITKVGFELVYRVTIRTQPTDTTTTAWCQGRWDCPGTLETTPASTTIMVTHLKSRMIPSNTPAVSPSIDVSVAKALSPTYQPSLTTASLTTHLGIVLSLN
jgi:hypothetical protein